MAPPTYRPRLKTRKPPRSSIPYFASYRTMGGRTLSNRPIRRGRARPGHPRGALPGHSESFRRLDDVDDRNELGHDGSAVVILARQTSCLLVGFQGIDSLVRRVATPH
jgi:hypothetical protein